MAVEDVGGLAAGAGAAAITGPILVAALRGGLTAGRAWRAVAAATVTGVAAESVPGALAMLGGLTAPLIFLAPLLALGAGVLVLLPVPPGSTPRRIAMFLAVGVRAAVVTGAVAFMAAAAALSTGVPWSGFNRGVVVGAWAAATVLSLVLDALADRLRDVPAGVWQRGRG